MKPLWTEMGVPMVGLEREMTHFHPPSAVCLPLLRPTWGWSCTGKVEEMN